MGSWIKYAAVAIIVFAVFFIVTNATVRHSSNVASTQEVETGIDSINYGNLRVNADTQFDKKTLISNLILDINEKYREQGHDIKINYVLFDENGEVTLNEDNVHSVQFNVMVIDSADRVVTKSTQRINLIER